jgi:hypothetical protein
MRPGRKTWSSWLVVLEGMLATGVKPEWPSGFSSRRYSVASLTFPQVKRNVLMLCGASDTIGTVDGAAVPLPLPPPPPHVTEATATAISAAILSPCCT